MAGGEGIPGAPGNGETLAHLLARRILLDGPLSVGAFMAEALGHPRLGYYMRQDPFGVGGDFTTAPEISQMFGELVGLWCAESWARLGGPGPFHLVEVGPGRGTLMADLLRAAAVLPLFRDNATVHLVETSPVLRERQRQTLQPLLGDALRWHDRLEEVPDGPTILVANEFFDALPIRQVQKTAHGWFERLVDIDPAGSAEEPRFRFVLEAFGSSGSRLVPDALRDQPDGSVVEVSPASQAVARAIGARLAAAPGAALLIDYGYAYGPVAGDTLQAVRRHAFAPVLDAPGEADLTAHVDFAAIAAAAREGGAESFGPVEQGEWLCRLGIRERAAALSAKATPAQARDIRAALDRLIDPAQMGRLFKLIALASPGAFARETPPAGFETP
ncbi:class I SAM-dependent methyltransferase [Azospirillum picis]|uniref:NADH dehydrogenase [ubiquinone] 1 alpha subcomplex assembly factor 7 n=1 Tax=Azospirillum picis TaxID=488438 RepID=A0ABU0MIH0_9PROT|nr:SAM-dependent methyltransferase [Azospirillum picis]MBP2299626.1 NADH dehydrogenase [ubiquinone] 1 alpha subcomplex assembly factor 7 [Azospirillum picis]MDQ0533247.1 NADH dehydrogenase [ubiquinone] 1 alpha subcomplex assembly factor 7 [Azospirillum picis]